MQEETDDVEAEQLWLEEAQRRYQAYKEGKIKSVPVEEALSRARKKIQ